MRAFFRFIGVFFLTISIVFAQKGKEKTRIFLAGSNAGFMFASFNSPYPSNQKLSAFGYEVEPFAGYFLKQNWVAGITGGYGKMQGDFIPTSTFYNIGYFGRFYIPLKNGVLNRHNPQPGFTYRFLPFVQLGHNFGNSYVHKSTGQLVEHNVPDVQWLRPAIGADIRLKPNFYLEMSFRQQWYLNVPAEHSVWGGTIGLNYIHDPEGKYKGLRKPIERKHQDVLRFRARDKKDSTQVRPFSKLILGTNLTYIWDAAYVNGNRIRGNTFHELTLHVNVATPLSQRFRLGFDYLRQFFRDPFAGSDRSWMAGPWLQFNFLGPKWKSRYSGKALDRIFLEIGGYKGNYCTCDPDNPYRLEGLNYIGFGGGVDLKLKPWLHLDLAFTNYQILNRVVGKYNYTQYILGLDFHLFKGMGQ